MESIGGPDTHRQIWIQQKNFISSFVLPAPRRPKKVKSHPRLPCIPFHRKKTGLAMNAADPPMWAWVAYALWISRRTPWSAGCITLYSCRRGAVLDHGVEARQGRLLRCVSTRLTFCWTSLVDAQAVLSHISDISRCLLVLNIFFPFPLLAVARLNAPEAFGVEEVRSKFSENIKTSERGGSPICMW